MHANPMVSRNVRLLLRMFLLGLTFAVIVVALLLA